MMSYIDINKEKEKALYRVFKEIEENGKSFVQRDTRIGQRISRSYDIPELVVTSNRRKNITAITTHNDIVVEETPYTGRGISRFHFRRKPLF